MRQRPLEVPPEHLFPTDDWRIVESCYSERYSERAETAFALSNGYLGIRGTFDEGRPARTPGTFISGFHETWPIVHTEDAYGLARSGQTIVNVPDATILRLYVDDEPLYVPTARLRRYARVLDMRAGTLVRELDWSTAAGKHVSVRTCRLVSFEHRHVAAITFEVVVHDRAAPVVISSEILNRQDAEFGADAPGPRPPVSDPRRATRLDGRILEPAVAEADGERLLLGYRTARSGMTLGIGVDHVVETAAPHEIRRSVEGDGGAIAVTVDAQPGVPIRITKFVSYQTSRAVPPRELAERCGRTLDRVVRDGFESLLADQRAHLDRFWDRADVRLDTGTLAVRTQQAVRWNLFQLAQATWRAEGSGVPAKGLTAASYEGHYFWDTEVYLLPFLSYPGRGSRATSCASATRCSLARASARVNLASAARCSPGARSTARRRRRTTRPGQRSTTSMPTSPTPSGATSRSAATSGSWPRSAPRCSSRRPGCGRTSASTRTTASSTSTA